MRWRGQRESDNVEDRRGQGFGGRSAPFRGQAGIGCLGLLLILAFAVLTGKDPSQLLQLLQSTQVVEQTVPAGGAAVAGDVEEGLAAAAAIGDDRLQRLSTGQVQPEAWTHGSSVQRVRWLRRGLQSGDPNACKTS